MRQQEFTELLRGALVFRRYAQDYRRDAMAWPQYSGQAFRDAHRCYKTGLFYLNQARFAREQTHVQ